MREWNISSYREGSVLYHTCAIFFHSLLTLCVSMLWPTHASSWCAATGLSHVCEAYCVLHRSLILQSPHAPYPTLSPSVPPAIPVLRWWGNCVRGWDFFGASRGRERNWRMRKLRMSYRLTKRGRENFRKWKLWSNGEFVLPLWVIQTYIDSLNVYHSWAYVQRCALFEGYLIYRSWFYTRSDYWFSVFWETFYGFYLCASDWIWYRTQGHLFDPSSCHKW